MEFAKVLYMLNEEYFKILTGAREDEIEGQPQESRKIPNFV